MDVHNDRFAATRPTDDDADRGRRKLNRPPSDRSKLPQRSVASGCRGGRCW